LVVDRDAQLQRLLVRLKRELVRPESSVIVRERVEALGLDLLLARRARELEGAAAVVERRRVFAARMEGDADVVGDHRGAVLIAQLFEDAKRARLVLEGQLERAERTVDVADVAQRTGLAGFVAGPRPRVERALVLDERPGHVAVPPP